MTDRFLNKTVMVVGATGGLGSTFARAFAAEGARLILTGRDTAALQRIAAELGDCAVTRQIDLAQLVEPDDWRAALGVDPGQLDVVVNAAGLDVRRPLSEHSAADIQRSLDVNLRGAIMLTQALLPLLTDDGQIVHVSGFADGRLAFPYHTVDVATRAGLFTFIEAVNRELALDQRRVLVSYFAPGPTETETEREFHSLWHELGIKIDPIDQVVRELFETIVRRQRVHLMGGISTQLFAKINAVSPQFADRVAFNRFGRILRRRFAGSNQPVVSRTSLWTRRLGMSLIVLSFLLYGGLLLVPFAPLENAAKIALAPLLIGLGEASFWIGGLLIGKEMLVRYKCLLNPCSWFSPTSKA